MTAIGDSRWQALSPHLDRALDMSVEERAAWLNSLQAEDPALAAELQTLLDEHRGLDEQRFLERPPSLPPGQASLAGQTLGAYTLESPIGQGGMGSVWLARRSDGRFEGKVAIKFLNLALLARGGAQRFQREGSILARLTHAHIARLTDAGVAAGGQPYLVLEYVEGEPIDRWCDANALSIEARVRLFLDVLGAVAHAHNKLILHRDLKPSNILVTKEGRVKLLDFGIAKLLDDEAIPAPAGELTQQAGRAFTPDYAAPEQVQGQDVSTATDVYALGVLLYVLLGGQHPTSASAKTPVERLQAVVDTEPARLSQAVVRSATTSSADLTDIADRRAATPLKLVRALRGDLDNIVAKALKKAPAERYGTVDAFADDLQRYLNCEPVSAHADTVRYRLTKFVQRYRVAVFTAASVALMLMAVSAVALWQMFEANRQRQVAQDEAARALSTREFLEFVLTDVGSSGRPYTTTELLERAERSVYAQYGSGASKRAIEQLIQIGGLYSSVGQQKKSLELAETAYRQAASAGYQELRREAACNLGQQYHFAGKVQEGAALLDQTISELRGRDAEAPTLIGCLLRKSDLELTRGNATAGVALATEAVTLATRLSSGSPLAQVAPRTQLAVAQRVAGDTRQADDAYRDLLELLKSMGRERTLDAIVLYGSWGKLKSDVGDIASAARLIESGIEISRAVRRDGKPDYVVSLNYAQRLLILKRLDEAQQYFSQVRSSAEAEEDADMELLSLIGIAAVQRERDDFVAAKAALDTAAQFALQKLPAEERAQRAILLETGRLYLANRSFTAALASLSEFVRGSSNTKAPTPDRPLALSAMAQAELGLGRGDDAIVHAAEASSMASRFALPGQPSYWIGYCLLAEAEVQQALGREEPGRQLAAQSKAQLLPTVGADHPLTQKAARLAGS